jgi:hypothetical protein
VVGRRQGRAFVPVQGLFRDGKEIYIKVPDSMKRFYEKQRDEV